MITAHSSSSSASSCCSPYSPYLINGARQIRQHKQQQVMAITMIAAAFCFSRQVESLLEQELKEDPPNICFFFFLSPSFLRICSGGANSPYTCWISTPDLYSSAKSSSGVLISLNRCWASAASII